MIKKMSPPTNDASLRVRVTGWSDTEVYGHAATIRRYTGRDRRVLGHLQHGWNPETGWTMGKVELISHHSVRHVWGRRQLAASAARGIRVASVVGAPWLYGPWRDEGPTRPDDRTELLFPLHGTDVHGVGYSHQQLAIRFAANAAGRMIACLHVNEYGDRRIVETYESFGIEVTTIGARFAPDYLDRLATLLRGADKVVTNRVSTAVFYAGSLGLPVELLKDGALIATESGEPSEITAIHTEIENYGSDPEAMRLLSLEELGAEFIREPEELARMLGMTGPRRTIYPAYLAASHAHRLYNRLRR